MSEHSFCIFRRIHVRLTWASQVAYECFSFTAVPQTDLKYFNLESSLGSAWLTGKSTPTGLDASPEPGSHGCPQPWLFLKPFREWWTDALLQNLAHHRVPFKPSSDLPKTYSLLSNVLCLCPMSTTFHSHPSKFSALFNVGHKALCSP